MNYTKPVLCAVIALAGCGSSSPVTTPTKYTEEQKPLPVDEATITLGWRNSKNGEDLNIVIDDETGCEYIVYSRYRTGATITPRIAKNGAQICHGNPNK